MDIVARLPRYAKNITGIVIDDVDGAMPWQMKTSPARHCMPAFLVFHLIKSSTFLFFSETRI